MFCHYCHPEFGWLAPTWPAANDLPPTVLSHHSRQEALDGIGEKRIPYPSRSARERGARLRVGLSGAAPGAGGDRFRLPGDGPKMPTRLPQKERFLPPSKDLPSILPVSNVPPQLNCCPGRWRTLKTHPSGQFQVADYLLIECFSEVRDPMGEAKQRQSATQKFVAQYPDCCFCGGIRPAVTREHMPPKALFDSSHRPDKLVMPACDECNRGTSTADLVAAVMSRWGYDISVKEGRDHFKLVNRVRRQAPRIVEEWNEYIDPAEARKHLENHGVGVPHNAGFATIGPLTICQLNAFAHKAVLALYFEHFRKLLPNEGRVFALWRTKEDYAQGVPSLLLQMMQRYGTLEQGTWNTKEIFEYRYELNEAEGLFACLARLRGGLFVSGFAASDASVIKEVPADEWIKPEDLLKMMHDPAFQKRQ
jgi:hypothetical protein